MLRTVLQGIRAPMDHILDSESDKLIGPYDLTADLKNGSISQVTNKYFVDKPTRLLLSMIMVLLAGTTFWAAFFLDANLSKHILLNNTLNGTDKYIVNTSPQYRVQTFRYVRLIVVLLVGCSTIACVVINTQFSKRDSIICTNIQQSAIHWIIRTVGQIDDKLSERHRMKIRSIVQTLADDIHEYLQATIELRYADPIGTLIYSAAIIYIICAVFFIVHISVAAGFGPLVKVLMQKVVINNENQLYTINEEIITEEKWNEDKQYRKQQFDELKKLLSFSEDMLQKSSTKLKLIHTVATAIANQDILDNQEIFESFMKKVIFNLPTTDTSTEGLSNLIARNIALRGHNTDLIVTAVFLASGFILTRIHKFLPHTPDTQQGTLQFKTDITEQLFDCISYQFYNRSDVYKQRYTDAVNASKAHISILSFVVSTVFVGIMVCCLMMLFISRASTITLAVELLSFIIHAESSESKKSQNDNSTRHDDAPVQQSIKSTLAAIGSKRFLQRLTFAICFFILLAIAVLLVLQLVLNIKQNAVYSIVAEEHASLQQSIDQSLSTLRTLTASSQHTEHKGFVYAGGLELRDLQPTAHSEPLSFVIDPNRVTMIYSSPNVNIEPYMQCVKQCNEAVFVKSLNQQSVSLSSLSNMQVHGFFHSNLEGEAVVFNKSLPENLFFHEQLLPHDMKLLHDVIPLASLIESYDSNNPLQSKSYSGGEKQRVSLARNLALFMCNSYRNLPSFWLLSSSSLGGVDVKQSQPFWKSLSSIAQQYSITVLVYTTEIAHLQYADSIIYIDKNYKTHTGDHQKMCALIQHYELADN
jgi:ABC-type dipeptide/oligopeptide/nickel transport system ATPase subunit